MKADDVCVDGDCAHSTSAGAGAGDWAETDGCRERVVVPIFDDAAGTVTGVSGSEVVLNLTCSDESLLVNTDVQGGTGQFTSGQRVSVAVRPERLTLADASAEVPPGSALHGTVR